MSELVRSHATRVPGPHGSWESTGTFVAQQPELDVWKVLTRLNKRKFVILAVALIVVVPAVIATFVATPLYRSGVLVEVNADSIPVLPYNDVADFVTRAPNTESLMRTQEQVLKGPTMLTAMTNRLTADEQLRDEVPRLAETYTVRRVPESQLFLIEYLAAEPEVAAKVVNSFAEEYVLLHFRNRQDARESARILLARELDDLEDGLQNSERQLVEYAEKNDIFSTRADQSSLAQQRLENQEGNVALAEAELLTATSKLEMIRQASVEEFPERLMSPVISEINSRLLNLEHELTGMRTSFGENWPAVIQKRQEIELVTEQLSRMKTSALNAAVEQASLDFAAAQRKHDLIMDSWKEQRAALVKYQRASIQYGILQREVQTNQKLYEGLLERIKQNGLMASSEFGSIRVIEPGIPSEEPATPNIPLNLAIATFCGLSLGVCAALITDYWDRSLSTVEEVEQLSALPSLGSVPYVKRLGSPKALGKEDPARRISVPSFLPPVSDANGKSSKQKWIVPPPEFSESFRTICSAILLSQYSKRIHVISVTSAESGEGKTSVTAHIGRALAQSGAKILLVDADFRRPQLAERFGIESQNGLSVFLSGNVSPLPAIHPTDDPGLFVIAAGPTPPNPVGLFSSPSMTAFLDSVSSTYHFVLIDTPPVLPVSDARVLGAKSDGVVLVVRAHSTRKNLVQRAAYELQSTGSNILGTVLNGTHKSDEPYAYQSYY